MRAPKPTRPRLPATGPDRPCQRRQRRSPSQADREQHEIPPPFSTTLYYFGGYQNLLITTCIGSRPKGKRERETRKIELLRIQLHSTTKMRKSVSANILTARACVFYFAKSLLRGKRDTGAALHGGDDGVLLQPGAS